MKIATPESSLGSRLLSAIGYRKRTQTEVAKAVGVSLNTISRITRGETLTTNTDLLRSLALELKVSADYLLGLSHEIEKRD